MYIGDPVNAARIFSEKEADELVLLDIDASKEGRDPNFELIAEIAGECFMPVAYGGGIRNIQQAERIIRSGIEKVVINSSAYESLDQVKAIAMKFGSQAVIGGIDVRKSLFGGYSVFSRSSSVKQKVSLEDHAKALVEAGVGEIFLNSIDQDGKMSGYDLQLVRNVVSKVKVPVVACGGAGNMEHVKQVLNEGGASAAAAGSMFVFHGRLKAVLISYTPLV